MSKAKSVDAAIELAATTNENEIQPKPDSIDAVIAKEEKTAAVAQYFPAIDEMSPSMWEIKAHEDGIEAVNRTTSRRYKGDMAGFNRILKGLE